MAITTTHSRMIGDLDAGSTYATTASLGTAAPLNVGTAANNVVQLDGTAKLPAVDGSQLTGISTGVFSDVFSATNSVLQSIPSAAWTVATFDTENVDQGNNFASNKFTAPSTGLYIFYASYSVLHASGTGTDQRISFHHYNSSDVSQEQVSVSKTTVHEAAQNGMRVFNMSADDYVNVQIYQQSGSARNLQGCQFFGWKIA